MCVYVCSYTQNSALSFFRRWLSVNRPRNGKKIPLKTWFGYYKLLETKDLRLFMNQKCKHAKVCLHSLFISSISNQININSSIAPVLFNFWRFTHFRWIRSSRFCAVMNLPFVLRYSVIGFQYRASDMGVLKSI